MFKVKLLVCAGALCMLALSSAGAAQPPDRGDTPGLGWGQGGSKALAVPGSVAGVGLPVVVAAGGYFWIRRRRRQGKQ